MNRIPQLKLVNPGTLVQTNDCYCNLLFKLETAVHCQENLHQLSTDFAHHHKTYKYPKQKHLIQQSCRRSRSHTSF